ncbi:MAG: prolipoprotein diacylglyceryl transferase [Deltaproteobacteria bacterium]|nr:prolipoprotein diacylglyceryl transferase [Deltaproteobacteria bacterium]
MHLPYFTLPPIDLSALGLGQIDWFTIFVFAAVIAGVTAYDRVVNRGGDIDLPTARLIPEVAVVTGFIGAHLMHVLAYHPELMREDPLILIKIWAGISSIGGFIGGLLGAAILLRWRKKPMLPYVDRIAIGITIAWIFGRLGCATSHDHPGSKTDFFLGVAFPDGVRHDLGLYELIFTVLILAPALFIVSRRRWRTGTLAGVWLILYGPIRFILDFLRADDFGFVDARYFNLTPAQYACLVMIIAGVLLLAMSHIHKWPMQPALWGKINQPPRQG